MNLTRFVPAAAMDKHVLRDMKGKQEGIDIEEVWAFSRAAASTN